MLHRNSERDILLVTLYRAVWEMVNRTIYTKACNRNFML